jgi:hypothetical protein
VPLLATLSTLLGIGDSESNGASMPLLDVTSLLLGAG